MKPASTPELFSPFTFERPQAEEVLKAAQKAADPDFYVQKATGRTLTKFLLVVGGLQVGGVFFWLLLVFAGVVDATMNLDGFMISQLVFFLLSLGIGLTVVIRHIKALKEEAKSMTPGLIAPLFERIDPDADAREFGEGDEVGPDVDVPGGNFELQAPRWMARGTIDDTSYEVGEYRLSLHGDGEELIPASLFYARCDIDEARARPVINTKSADADDIEGRHKDSDDHTSAPDFHLHISDGALTLTRHLDDVLIPDADDATDANVDEIYGAGCKIADALNVLWATGR